MGNHQDNEKHAHEVQNQVGQIGGYQLEHLKKKVMAYCIVEDKGLNE
jgi:hypothetical protein